MFNQRIRTVDIGYSPYMLAVMTDEDALDFLAAKLGTKAAVATALGVTPQVMNNWTNEGRGIAASKRARVWMMVNDHGGNLSRDWLLAERKSEAA